MFSIAAFLYATLVPIFAQPYNMIQGINDMMPQNAIPQIIPQMVPQHAMPPMMPQHAMPPMMPLQNIPQISPGNQGYSTMFSGPLMPSQLSMQDQYQPSLSDNSFPQQLLLLIMSAYNRLTTYIQLLANHIKYSQYNPFHDTMGPNMSQTPTLVPNNLQSPIEAQQNYQNQLLLQQQQQQQQQQQSEYQLQLLDEEKRLQLEAKKQAEAEKINSGSESEEEKKQLEPKPKFKRLESSKNQSIPKQRPQKDSNTTTTVRKANNTSDVEQTSHSNDMKIGTESLPHINTSPTKHDVFQTSQENVDIQQNIEKQKSKPQKQQLIIQCDDLELDQNFDLQHRTPIKRYCRYIKTQISPTSDPNMQKFEHLFQYKNYLLTKLQEKKQQFQQKQEKELKQPWKNPKDHSKFIHSRYIDHLLHKEHDSDDLKNNNIQTG